MYDYILPHAHASSLRHRTRPYDYSSPWGGAHSPAPLLYECSLQYRLSPFNPPYHSTSDLYVRTRAGVQAAVHDTAGLGPSGDTDFAPYASLLRSPSPLRQTVGGSNVYAAAASHERTSGTRSRQAAEAHGGVSDAAVSGEVEMGPSPRPVTLQYEQSGAGEPSGSMADSCSTFTGLPRLPCAGHKYARSYNEDVVRLWSVERELTGHDGCINTIHIDEEGEFLLTGSDDRCLCVYDTTTWQRVWKAETHHAANIFSAVFLPHERCRRILSCSLDGTISLLDTETAESSLYLKESSMASSIAVSPHWPGMAFVGYCNGSIATCDVRCVGEPLPPEDLVTHRPCPSLVSQVNALAVHERYPYLLACATDSRYVFLHDVRMGTLTPFAALGVTTVSSNGSPDGVGGLSFSQRGDFLAVNYRGGDLYVIPWEAAVRDALDPADPAPLSKTETAEALCDCPALAEQYTPPALAAMASRIRRRTTLPPLGSVTGLLPRTDASRVPLIHCRPSTHCVGRENEMTMFKEVAFLEDDTVVCTGSDDGHIYFWRTCDGGLIHRVRGDGDVVNGVLYHRKVKKLICCGIDSTAKVLTAAVDPVVQGMPVAGGTSPAYTRDGRTDRTSANEQPRRQRGVRRVRTFVAAAQEDAQPTSSATGQSDTAGALGSDEQAEGSAEPLGAVAAARADVSAAAVTVFLPSTPPADETLFAIAPAAQTDDSLTITDVLRTALLFTSPATGTAGSDSDDNGDPASTPTPDEERADAEARPREAIMAEAGATGESHDSSRPYRQAQPPHPSSSERGSSSRSTMSQDEGAEEREEEDGDDSGGSSAVASGTPRNALASSSVTSSCPSSDDSLNAADGVAAVEEGVLTRRYDALVNPLLSGAVAPPHVDRRHPGAPAARSGATTAWTHAGAPLHSHALRTLPIPDHASLMLSAIENGVSLFTRKINALSQVPSCIELRSLLNGVENVVSLVSRRLRAMSTLFFEGTEDEDDLYRWFSDDSESEDGAETMDDSDEDAEGDEEDAEDTLDRMWAANEERESAGTQTPGANSAEASAHGGGRAGVRSSSDRAPGTSLDTPGTRASSTTVPSSRSPAQRRVDRDSRTGLEATGTAEGGGWLGEEEDEERAHSTPAPDLAGISAVVNLLTLGGMMASDGESETVEPQNERTASARHHDSEDNNGDGEEESDEEASASAPVAARALARDDPTREVLWMLGMPNGGGDDDDDSEDSDEVRNERPGTVHGGNADGAGAPEEHNLPSPISQQQQRQPQQQSQTQRDSRGAAPLNLQGERVRIEALSDLHQEDATASTARGIMADLRGTDAGAHDARPTEEAPVLDVFLQGLDREDAKRLSIHVDDPDDFAAVCYGAASCALERLMFLFHHIASRWVWYNAHTDRFEPFLEVVSSLGRRLHYVYAPACRPSNEELEDLSAMDTTALRFPIGSGRNAAAGDGEEQCADASDGVEDQSPASAEVEGSVQYYKQRQREQRDSLSLVLQLFFTIVWNSESAFEKTSQQDAFYRKLAWLQLASAAYAAATGRPTRAATLYEDVDGWLEFAHIAELGAVSLEPPPDFFREAAAAAKEESESPADEASAAAAAGVKFEEEEWQTDDVESNGVRAARRTDWEPRARPPSRGAVPSGDARARTGCPAGSSPTPPSVDAGPATLTEIRQREWQQRFLCSDCMRSAQWRCVPDLLPPPAAPRLPSEQVRQSEQAERSASALALRRSRWYCVLFVPLSLEASSLCTSLISDYEVGGLTALREELIWLSTVGPTTVTLATSRKPSGGAEQGMLHSIRARAHAFLTMETPSLEVDRRACVPSTPQREPHRRRPGAATSTRRHGMQDRAAACNELKALCASVVCDLRLRLRSHPVLGLT